MAHGRAGLVKRAARKHEVKPTGQPWLKPRQGRVQRQQGADAERRTHGIAVPPRKGSSCALTDFQRADDALPVIGVDFGGIGGVDLRQFCMQGGRALLIHTGGDCCGELRVNGRNFRHAPQ